MSACDSVNETSESFVIPGTCTREGCQDTQALCADACNEMTSAHGNHFVYAWSVPTCHDD